VEKATKEMVSSRFEKQYRKGKEWFFLLNDVKAHWE
jgi:hypothetical protein